MDAKELRIGNTINRHFEGGNGVAEIVTSRTIFDCHANPTGKFSYSGIPLTPELLEKCGFEKDDKWWGDGISYYSKPPIDVRFGNEEIENILDAVFYGQEELPIKHLHQLQNLYFALTNQELIINL